MTHWLESRGFDVASHPIRSELLEKFAYNNIHMRNTMYQAFADSDTMKDLEKCIFNDEELQELKENPIDYKSMIPADFIPPR